MNVDVNTNTRDAEAGTVARVVQENRQLEWIRRERNRKDWKEWRSRRERWFGKEGRKDGGRDLDLYSAIVVPSSTEQSLTPLTSNSCLLIPRSRTTLLFIVESHAAATASYGIAKEQPRGRIYCSYCNVDESPAEFRDPAVYFRRSARIYVHVE